MKVQIVKQGNQIFLRGYLFGFKEVYYDTEFYNEWRLSRHNITLEKANELINKWIAEKENAKKYKAIPEEIIVEKNI